MTEHLVPGRDNRPVTETGFDTEQYGEPPRPPDVYPVPYASEVPHVDPNGKKRHWVRYTLIGVGALIVGLVVAGVAAGTDSPTKHAVAQPVATPSVSVSDTASATTPIEEWILGDGYRELTAVQTDVSSVTADAKAQDISAVETDGTQLSLDAGLAASDPPPVDPADYSAGMREYAAAGDAMAIDDFKGATRHLDAGNRLIQLVTAQIKPAGV